ncbi:adenosine receptor A2b-like [Scyliorhinus canicula]|uniref:adenosine receptor A2b-like n=1 Tax=Scyliorhinus canicula TaxID=7830 RepID=UPI0018F3F869|nr:adenosine receptor A2b-like [Scyliorhinus canicula]
MGEGRAASSHDGGVYESGEQASGLFTQQLRQETASREIVQIRHSGGKLVSAPDQKSSAHIEDVQPLCVGVTAGYTATRYKGLITGRRVKLIIMIFWILSFVIGLTPFFGWNQRNKVLMNCTHLVNNSVLQNCLVKCLFLNVVNMNYMVYFNFLGCVLTPLLIMLGIYVKIFIVARMQLQKIELNSVNSDTSRTYLQNQVRVAKSLSIIVGFFAFCWLPLHILNCINHFHPQYFKTMDSHIMNAAIVLSHANSVGNPIIYAYKIEEFRNTFHKIIFKQILCRTDDGFKPGMFGETQI